MSKLTIIIVAGAVLSGCGVMPRPDVSNLDVSTGEETAVIDGGPCSVYGPVSVGNGDYEGTIYNIRRPWRGRVTENRFEGGNVVDDP